MFRSSDRQPASRFTEEKPPAPDTVPMPAETPAPMQTMNQNRTVEPSIGEQIAAQLDAVTRREQELREIQDLALRRVAELRGDQLRRLLEFVD